MSLFNWVLSSSEWSYIMVLNCSTNALNNRYYEDHPEQYDFGTANAALAGLGIGLLSTAAVSLSQSVSNLALAGAEVVRLSFRLGVVVGRISQNLEPREPTSPPSSWAAVVPDVDVEDV